MPFSALRTTACRLVLQRLRGLERCRWAGRNPAEERGKELARIDGLAEVIVHTSGETLFAIAVHGVCGHGDDRKSGEAGIEPNRFGGANAIHDRHLHIHEDDVVIVFGELLNGGGTVFGDIDLEVCLFKETENNFTIEFIVFNEQDAGAVDRREIDFISGGRSGLGRLCVRTAENLDDGIEEYGRSDRLDEDVFEGGLFDISEDFFATIGSDHDEVGSGIKIESANLTASFDAIDSGHLPVDEDDVVELVACGGLANEFDTFVARGRLIDDEGHAEKHGGENFASLGIVVDDKDATAAKILTRSAPDCAVALTEISGKPESGTFSDFTGDTHIATEKLGKFLRNSETESGPAVLACGGSVSLFEGLE